MRPVSKLRTLGRVTRNFLRYKLGEPAVSFCPYFVTVRCNLRCSYCPVLTDTGSELFDYSRRLGYELSTGEAKRAIDQLSELGVVWMSFSGGEPLLRRDLEEMASHAKEKGITTVLDTNATLITRKRAESLGKCFDNVVVSLEGLEETNDRLRGRGVFRRTMRGIRLLKENTVCTVGINFVITNQNYQEIEEVVGLARETVDSILFQPVCHADVFLLRGEMREGIREELLRVKRENPHFVLNDITHLEFLADHLTGRKSWFQCDAFDLYLSLMPNGDLCGCYYPYPAGNVREKPVGELREVGRKRKEELYRRCRGCAVSSFFHVSALFRRSFLNLFRRHFSP